MQAEVPEKGAGRQRVVGEGSRRGREHDLAAVGDCGDAGGAMDLEADQTRAFLRRLTGMDAHPHAQLLASRPLMGSEGPLHLDHSRDAGTRRVENGEEPVSLGADLPSLVRSQAGTDEGVVVGEDLGVGVTAKALQ